MFSLFAFPPSINTVVMRSAIARFCSTLRPSTQVICTCGTRSASKFHFCKPLHSSHLSPPSKAFPTPVLESSLMHPATGQLQELQRLDQLIAALQSDLAGLPKRMRDADAQLNGARTAVANAKNVHSHALTERKKFELDVEQWKGRAKKYREQSASVKTNEAYKALQHEIATAEA